jgi:hypothetical protein
VTPDQEMLGRIDDAIARFDQALKAVRQIPKRGQDGVAVDGIEHELIAIAKRLQTLRDELAGDGDRAESG